MEKRICSSSGIELPVLGAGCWAFGGGEYWGRQDQDEVNAIVRASLDLGISYFDTAEVYNEGRSEAALGVALRGIPRDRYIIGTKISPSNCYYDEVLRHCEASLKRLETDHIDIYMIHWPVHPHSIRHFTNDRGIIDNPPRISETIDAMQHLKEQGKIGHYGVSNFSRQRLEQLPGTGPVLNQLPYNLLCRAIEFDTIEACRVKGMGIIGYMALMQGILADIYPDFSDIPVWQRRTRHFSSSRTAESRHGEEGAEEETRTALSGIRRICSETGLNMADLSLRWIMMNGDITCTLAGSRSVKELTSNAEAVSRKLSPDIMHELDMITRPLMLKLGNHFDYYESAANDRTL
jgi:aryl-alcohol dehydrogenase-like predicted oxidoreductase